MDIASSLKYLGFADVLVLIDQKDRRQSLAAASEVPLALLKHFVLPPNSQDASLLEVLNSQATKLTKEIVNRNITTLGIDHIEVPSTLARYYPNLGMIFGTVDRNGLAALKKESTVKAVVSAPQLRLIKPVSAAVPTVNAGFTWGLRAMGIDELHKNGILGKGILVGHLDTGIDGVHPALQGAIADYAEFDDLGNEVAGARPRDSGQHGTHTAGTIAGRSVKGVTFGTAPEAKLVSAMVIEGGNVLARVLSGLNWALGKDIRILSMSLGFPGYDEALLIIIKTLRARGVLPVIAVGNEGAGTSRYPGNYPDTLSVGAIDSTLQVPDFSGSQLFLREKDALVPDLVAPGVDVISCVPGGGYMQMSGSSMATPHIAGLCALLMQAEPKATINDIESAIFASCSIPPGVLPSRANRGFPNAVKALQLLRNTVSSVALAGEDKKRKKNKVVAPDEKIEIAT